MTNNKEKITQATMTALQSQVEEEIATREICKKQLSKIVEEYVREDNLSEFLDIFVTATTEEELFDVLRQLVDNYDNNHSVEF